MAENFDLSLTGFEDIELEELMAEPSEDETGAREGEDEVPDAPEDPVSRRGDLWILGPHRLLCGDATVITDLDRLMAGRKADLCFTDSPYNVDYAGGPGAEREGRGRRIRNDALGDGFGRFLYYACVGIIAYTAGAIYMCMSSSELHTLQKAFVAAGGHWSTFIIWAKDRFTLGRSDYQRQFEPILYGWPEGASHHWCGARDQGARPQVLRRDRRALGSGDRPRSDAGRRRPQLRRGEGGAARNSGGGCCLRARPETS